MGIMFKSPQGKEKVTQMISGANNALEGVLALSKADNVLIVTDYQKKPIGEAFKLGAEKIGSKVSVYTLPEEMRPLKDIPTNLKLEGFNVILNIFEGFVEETPFRVKLSTLEMKCGAKVGHAPGITEDMMIKGAMNVDFKEVAIQAKKMVEAFENADKVHITTKLGTDIEVGIRDRPFETDVEILEGRIGNLPAGEIWCAPEETRTNGTLIADGSIGDIGKITEPITMKFENGKVIDFKCTDPTLLERVLEITSLDDEAKIVGELGIGLNPNARLTGNMLEDEKAGRTAHIALGYNVDMPGGQNASKTHRDFLFYEPDMTITYKDGSTKKIMKNGNMVY